MAEHTPTPWAVRPKTFDDWGWIRGADGELACIARHHDRKDDDKHRMDKTDPYAANAAFIVKAVNSYDEAMMMLGDVPGETLLERLTKLQGWYLEIQILVGNLKHEVEVSKAANRLTAPVGGSR